MASRPKSWVGNYDAGFDLPFHQDFGHSSFYERQHMLAESSRQSARPSDNEYTPVASSSNPATRPSSPSPHSVVSPPYQDSPLPESVRAGPPETVPNFSRMPRSASFTSSPLNPSPMSPAYPGLNSPFARPGSRGSAYITRIPSEESRALSAPYPFTMGGAVRGSMILYRRADLSENALQPPSFPGGVRSSMTSTSGDSFVSLSSDSKYPANTMTPERGLIAYAYDPSLDDSAMDDEDVLHDPEGKDAKVNGRRSWRGFKNLAALGLLVIGLLALFVAYPVFTFFRDNGVAAAIVGNTRINSTGQAVPVSFDSRSQIPIYSFIDLIDPATPKNARSRIGEDGQAYRLVFSDEFEADERTFSKGNDPIWEAIDDQFHDPQQVTTSNGHLSITAVSALPRDGAEIAYVSGALRTRGPFCLQHGFAEIGVAAPEGGLGKRFYWSGSWRSINGGPAIVPSGASLHQDLLLDLSVGIAGTAGRSMSVLPSPDTVLIDYIRLYKKAGHASACDSSSILQNVDVFLDFP